MDTFFSIILPTYNRAQLIRETLETLLNQHYPYYEIIVVDDGSTDSTKEVVEREFIDEKKLRYYYKQNEERGAARNFGMAKASGNYAIFFDSDDWMKPDYLQLLHDAIKSQRHPPFMVAAKYTFKDENGREWHSAMHNIAEGWYGINDFLKGNMLACNFCIQLRHPDLKPFPEDRSLASMEDWLFLLHNLVNQKIFIKDRVGVVMREHSGRSMANNKVIIAARKEATKWALKQLPLNKEQQKTLVAFSSYFCGIHEYLEGNISAALKFSLRAMRSYGTHPLFLMLFIKSIVGKKTIDRLKRYAG